MRINHKLIDNGHIIEYIDKKRSIMSDKNPVFDQFKDKSENEKEKKLDIVRMRIAQLAMQIEPMIAPGATIIVDVKTGKLVKTGDKTAGDVQLVISKPQVISSIIMEAVLKPEAKDETKSADIIPTDN